MPSARARLDLDHATRARLLAALGRALDAGLPAERALLAVQDVAGGKASAHLAGCARSVAHGSSLARVLVSAGLLVGTDAALLEAGEKAGATARVLTSLAARFERLAGHARRLRARLALPLAVLVIGVLVLPLPALVAGEIDTAAYVLQVLAATALAGMLLLVSARVLRSVTRGALPAWAEGVPLLGHLLAAQTRLVVLEQLHALLDAGVAAREATRVCRQSAPGGLQRRWLGTLAQRLAAGDGVADALLASRLVKAGEEHALIASGEAAGRLEELLARVLEAARARLDSRIDSVARWTPRVVYGAVIVLLTAGFLA